MQTEGTKAIIKVFQNLIKWILFIFSQLYLNKCKPVLCIDEKIHLALEAQNELIEIRCLSREGSEELGKITLTSLI